MSQPLRASLLGPGFWQLSRSFRRLRAKARGALRSAARAGLITRGGSVLVLSAVGASTAAGDGNDPFKEWVDETTHQKHTCTLQSLLFQRSRNAVDVHAVNE